MASHTRLASPEPFPWQLGVYDAHCHPTDTMDSLTALPDMKCRVLTIMATRAQDQRLVAQTADGLGIGSPDVSTWNQGGRILPCFGWHPWFAHHLFDDLRFGGRQTLDADDKARHYRMALTPEPDDKDFLTALPDPRPLSWLLAQTRHLLQRYPAALIGEVGLDKAFRLPGAWAAEHHEQRDAALTPGGREGRRLSPYRVTVAHQKAILLAQLRLAGEFDRAVSLHGVQAHGVLYDTLKESWRGYEKPVNSKKQLKRMAKDLADPAVDHHDSHQSNDAANPKPYPPRICLHSYSGPAETAQQYLHPSIPVDFFFSFSTAVNFNSPAAAKAEDVIRMLPSDRILAESDLHIAGEQMDQHLEDIIRKICHIKAWSLEDGVKQLGVNWRRFAFGAT